MATRGRRAGRGRSRLRELIEAGRPRASLGSAIVGGHEPRRSRRSVRVLLGSRSARHRRRRVPIRRWRRNVDAHESVERARSVLLEDPRRSDRCRSRLRAHGPHVVVARRRADVRTGAVGVLIVPHERFHPRRLPRHVDRSVRFTSTDRRQRRRPVHRPTTGARTGRRTRCRSASSCGIGVDMQHPYYIYGGLQDNGVWGGPSATRHVSGVTASDWYKMATADGAYAQVDPTNHNRIYTCVAVRQPAAPRSRQRRAPERFARADPRPALQLHQPVSDLRRAIRRRSTSVRRRC